MIFSWLQTLTNIFQFPTTTSLITTNDISLKIIKNDCGSKL